MRREASFYRAEPAHAQCCNSISDLANLFNCVFWRTLRGLHFKPNLGTGPSLGLIKLSLVAPFLPGHRTFHDTKQKIGHFLKCLDHGAPLQIYENIARNSQLEVQMSKAILVGSDDLSHFGRLRSRTRHMQSAMINKNAACRTTVSVMKWLSTVESRKHA